MKTTQTMIVATAALTGLAILIWNRITSRNTLQEISNDETREKGRHLNSLFSRLKQQHP